MYERKAKTNTCFLAEFSLGELGGTSLPPLTENHPAQKPLAEMGGTHTPRLTEKIRYLVFDSFPKFLLRFVNLRRNNIQKVNLFNYC